MRCVSGSKVSMETPMDCEDLKEFEMSRLISFSNDIVPSVMPFIHKSVQNYGKFGGKKTPLIYLNCFINYIIYNEIRLYGNIWYQEFCVCC